MVNFGTDIADPRSSVHAPTLTGKISEKKWPYLEKKGQAEIFTIYRIHYYKQRIQNPSIE